METYSDPYGTWNLPYLLKEVEERGRRSTAAGAAAKFNNMHTRIYGQSNKATKQTNANDNSFVESRLAA